MRTNEEKFESVKDAIEKINVGKITILTGNNASGKSLIRKVLWQRIKELVNDGRGDRQYVWETSMERRTSQLSALGALSGAFRDNEWIATSANTILSINRFFQTDSETKHYIVFDEPEVGCGEEVQLGIANKINEKSNFFKNDNLGLLIITHSRLIVKNTNCDVFINLEGRTKEEWLNREVVAKDIDELYEENNSFFSYLQNHIRNCNEI